MKYHHRTIFQNSMIKFLLIIFIIITFRILLFFNVKGITNLFIISFIDQFS